VPSNVPPFDGVESDVNVVFVQARILGQIFKDFWHYFPTVFGVLENVEKGNVDPEEMSVLAF
jgi:hypothetical protein